MYPRLHQARRTDTRLTIDPAAPDHETLDRAAEVIRAGGLVVAPTETRYGLLGQATDPTAVRRLCAAKGRAFHHPVAAFVASIEELDRYAEVGEAARTLAARFLPGPLTLVLRTAVNWPEPIVVAGKTGFRISPSPTIAGLLERVGRPLTATSANLSGQPEEITVAAIEMQLGESVALYLEAGPLSGKVSTVLDCTGRHPKILREGAISRQSLGEVTELDRDE